MTEHGLGRRAGPGGGGRDDRWTQRGAPRSEVRPGGFTELLTDADDEVARTAWRTAVGLVPEGREAGLADTLSTQLGQGDREVQRSLSRAFAALGAAALPFVGRATTDRDACVRAHAIATERLMRDPDQGFDAAIAEAHVARPGAPLVVE